MGGQREMKKTIKIGNKDYFMKSSAYTQFKYRDITGRRLLDDIQEISKINKLSEEEQVSKVEDIIELLFKISYVMIEEADSSQVTSYEEFLKNTEGIFDTTEWINEVIELAVAPISRGLQTSPQNQ